MALASNFSRWLSPLFQSILFQVSWLLGGFCPCLNLFYSSWILPLSQSLLFWVACASVSFSFVFWMSMCKCSSPRRICTQVIVSFRSSVKNSKDLCLHVQFTRDMCTKSDVFSWSWQYFYNLDEKLTQGVYQTFQASLVTLIFKGCSCVNLGSIEDFFVIFGFLKDFYANYVLSGLLIDSLRSVPIIFGLSLVYVQFLNFLNPLR